MKPCLLRGHEKPISIVKFNFDGDLLFTGAAEKKVNLWYSISGERIGSYDTKGAVKTLDVTIDSTYLVIGTLVGTIEFFKVDGGVLLGNMALDAKIKTVQFSYGDKKLLVLAEWYSKDRVDQSDFLIFDFDSIMSSLKNNTKPEIIKPKAETTITFKRKFSQICWGPLNKTIIAAGEDGNLEIVDLDGNIVKSVEVSDHQISSFAVAKDFSMLMTCSKEGAKLFDPETLELLKTFKTEVPMYTAAFSPLISDKKDPKYHAIMGGGVSARDAAGHKAGGFEIRLANLVFGEEMGKIAGHFGPVNTLAFYPDGRGFVSGGEEGIIRLFRFDKKYFTDFE